MKIEKMKDYISLHMILFLYSIGALLSKLAAGYDFLSIGFISLYTGVLIICLLYALLWQQILKKMTLFTTYANKAVTVIWGLVWGRLIFKEHISGANIAGTFIIIIGICIVASGEKQ